MRRNGPLFLDATTRGRLVTLALIAVLLRGLIPTGFMPGSVNGHPQLVICNGHMPGMAVPGERRHSGGTGDVLCPFAHCAAASPVPALPPLASAYLAITIPVRLIL